MNTPRKKIILTILNLTFCFFVCVFFLLKPTFVDAAIISKPPTNLGLVGYWSFNEGTSTTLTDFSGNQKNGALTNFPTNPWVNGKRGKALSFDGVDDVVVLPSNPISTSFTVSAWIKATTAGEGNAGHIVAVRNVATNDPNIQVRMSTTGSLRFSVVFQPGDVAGAWEVSKNLLDGWHHIVVSYNGSSISNDPTIYIDGVAQSLSTDSNPASGSLAVSSYTWTIGNTDTGSATFDGLIDEVRVYGRVLSASEITTLYNAKSVKSNVSLDYRLQDGLVGHWSFDGITANFSKNILYGLASANDASIANMSTTSSLVIGKLGQAFNFDGSDDIISTPVNDTLFSENQPVTISAWIYPRTKGENNGGRIVQRGPATGGAAFHMANAGTNALQFLVSGSADTARRTANDAVTLNQWQHVLVTWDGSTTGANVRMYVNGVETSYAATNNGTSPTDNSTEPLRIGNSTDGSRTFDGYIDDLRVYNRVVSPEEITKLANLAKGKVNSTQTTILPTGLIGYWPFDGKYMDWSKNEILDASGNARTGTSSNIGTTTGVFPGRSGQALLFNGSNSRASFANSVLDGTGNSPSTQITLSAWIYPLNSSATQCIICKSSAGSARPFQFNIQAGSDIRFMLYDGSSLTTVTTATSPIQARRWHHVVGTWDGVTMSIYVNGAFITSTPFAGPLSYTSSANLNIGYSVSNNFPFNGYIDEPRVYNRALSPSEILRLYNTGK